MQEQYGLSLAWWDVMQQLADGPKQGLRMSELADSVLLTRSGITRLVDRMIEAGLIVREPCPGDRRGYYAVITQKRPCPAFQTGSFFWMLGSFGG